MFNEKIDQLFARKKLQAATLHLEDTADLDTSSRETSAQLKQIPFNVSTVIRQINDETERRAKTLKRGGRKEYRNFDEDEA